MRRGVLGDDVEALLGRRGAVQLALQHGEAAHHRVDVGVLEAGEQQATGEVDDLGVGSGQLGELVVGPDGGDPPAGHRDRRRDRACPRRGGTPIRR